MFNSQNNINHLLEICKMSLEDKTNCLSDSVNPKITIDFVIDSIIGECDDEELQTIVSNNLCSDIETIAPYVKFDDLLNQNDDIASAEFLDLSIFLEKTYEDCVDSVAVLRKAIVTDFDSLRPKRKAGYKPVQVIRKGKKVWINKRISSVKKILSPAQKRGLMKARRKAHTPQAERKKEKSIRMRATRGLK